MLENGNSNSNGNGFFMPVAPAYGGGGGFGNGGFGSDGWWILLLLLFAGGWGNGFGGGFGGGFGNDIYPWMNQSNQINDGFRDQMLNDNITSIRDGINGISTQLCNSFAQAEISANARQMADMNQMFAVQSSLQNCCCENRAGLADLKYTVATENCADRQVINDGVRSIIENQASGVQRILDQMCADKIDSKNEKIADLERQLTMANLAASQTAQTSRLLADNAAQTVALEQYLNPVPIPAYIVQNPNCCQQNTCGCGNF